MKSRIRRLTKTQGYTLALSNVTEFSSSDVDKMYCPIKLDIDGTNSTLILSKHEVELLRDFFAHTASNMKEAINEQA